MMMMIVIPMVAKEEMDDINEEHTLINFKAMIIDQFIEDPRYIVSQNVSRFGQKLLTKVALISKQDFQFVSCQHLNFEIHILLERGY